VIISRGRKSARLVYWIRVPSSSKSMRVTAALFIAGAVLSRQAGVLARLLIPGVDTADLVDIFPGAKG
jgi:hypothetical protein